MLLENSFMLEATLKHWQGTEPAQCPSQTPAPHFLQKVPMKKSKLSFTQMKKNKSIYTIFHPQPWAPFASCRSLSDIQDAN